MTVTKIRYRILWSVALILVGFLSVATSLQAETIHVIIAADTDPERATAAIAKATQHDKEEFERIFRANVPESQLAVHAIPLEKTWSADILRIVDELVVAPEDTVVFFYTGHGAYDTAKKQLFFQIAAKPATTEKSDLYRNDVLDRILAKNPRLTVMISDCCNVPASANVVYGARSAAAAPATIRPQKTISPLFESLFINIKGVVDITSSKLGEASGINAQKGGSCFAIPMIDLLSTHKDNYDLDWKTFVDELTPKVQEAFTAAYPDGAKTTEANPRQYKQTVFVYSLPGMSATRLYDGTVVSDSAETAAAPSVPEVRQGPRFGVRAVAENGGGIRVTELIPGSPGERSGLDVGDVILEINGKAVNTEQEYSDAVDASPKQMRLKLKNSRNGNIITGTVELGW